MTNSVYTQRPLSAVSFMCTRGMKWKRGRMWLAREPKCSATNCIHKAYTATCDQQMVVVENGRCCAYHRQ